MRLESSTLASVASSSVDLNTPQVDEIHNNKDTYGIPLKYLVNMVTHPEFQGKRCTNAEKILKFVKIVKNSKKICGLRLLGRDWRGWLQPLI
jgi:hypothetical protein